MIKETNQDLGPLSMVVIDVGNYKVAVARWVEGNVLDVERVAVADREGILAALQSVREKCENQQRQAIVIASVVPAVTEWLARHVEEELNLRPFIVGDNTPLPMEVDLKEPQTVGVDRVCSAAAAFERIEGTCAVVTVGSAVTIDMIDEEGVFQGGTIFPGLHLQAKALAEGTARLPLVDPQGPIVSIGKDTHEAIRGGLRYGMAGAIRGIVEQMATENNRWPQVVLTGGASGLLKDELDFVDNWVPDLCLMGIGLAYMRRVEEMS